MSGSGPWAFSVGTGEPLKVLEQESGSAPEGLSQPDCELVSPAQGGGQGSGKKGTPRSRRPVAARLISFPSFVYEHFALQQT